MDSQHEDLKQAHLERLEKFGIDPFSREGYVICNCGYESDSIDYPDACDEADNECPQCGKRNLRCEMIV